MSNDRDRLTASMEALGTQILTLIKYVQVLKYRVKLLDQELAYHTMIEHESDKEEVEEEWEEIDDCFENMMRDMMKGEDDE